MDNCRRGQKRINIGHGLTLQRSLDGRRQRLAQIKGRTADHIEPGSWSAAMMPDKIVKGDCDERTLE